MGNERRGRVLRVKLGYNPNSSSVGSALPMYLVFAAASGALTALLLHLTGAVGASLRRRKPPCPTPAEPPRSEGDAGHDQASRDED
jgi:hypothetical protein